MVEREGRSQPLPFHQDERDAVREADPLVGEPSERIPCRPLVGGVRPQDREGRRLEPAASGPSGEGVSRPAGQQGGRFVQYEIAGDGRPAVPLQPFPLGDRGGVVLVPRDVTGEKRSGVDEDHAPPPFPS